MHFQCRITVIWFLGKHFWWEKIWRFLAPGKRNLGLIMPGADVAVPGSCLSDYWAFWTPGTFSSTAAAAPWREGGDKRGRRKESSDEEGWVCGVSAGRNCSLCLGLCSFCSAPAKRCHLVPSPPTDTDLPISPPSPLHAQASPMRPHSRGWLPCPFPVGMWVPASSRNKAPEKSKCYKMMQNPVSKSLSHCSIKILHVIPFICVYLKCVKCSLWKELESLQHQRAIGMHPLSKHTHSPTPTRTPCHTQKHQIRRTRLFALARLILDKHERSLWNRLFRNCSTVTWVRAVMYLVTRCSECPKSIMKGLKCLCQYLGECVKQKLLLKRIPKSSTNTSTSSIFLSTVKRKRFI